MLVCMNTCRTGQVFGQTSMKYCWVMTSRIESAVYFLLSLIFFVESADDFLLRFASGVTAASSGFDLAAVRCLAVFPCTASRVT